MSEAKDDLVRALEEIAKLQDDKIHDAAPDLVLTILQLKVEIARTALKKARGE